MADYGYKRIYSADIDTDNISIMFKRYLKDVTDVMSDCIKPDLEFTDDFIITIAKIETIYKTVKYDDCTVTHKRKKILATMKINTKDKRLANGIWYLAKHGTNFDTFQEMDKKGIFNR